MDSSIRSMEFARNCKLLEVKSNVTLTLLYGFVKFALHENGTVIKATTLVLMLFAQKEVLGIRIGPKSAGMRRNTQVSDRFSIPSFAFNMH